MVTECPIVASGRQSQSRLLEAFETAMGGGDEVPDFPRIFPSGGGFHATGGIHGRKPCDADRLGDVFRRVERVRRRQVIGEAERHLGLPFESFHRQ